MSAPVLLDLFCCQGGASRGYADAGFEVLGVDIEQQDFYPYPIVVGDAINILARLIDGEGITFVDPAGQEITKHMEDFAAIHASPPCQSFLNLGAVNRALGRDWDYPNLIRPTRELLQLTGVPWVIENVQDASAHLMNPVRVCGTGLRRPLRRHRLFESSIPLEGVACDHKRFSEPKYWTSWRPKGEKRLSTVVQVYGNAGGQHEWPAAMGIDWMDRHGYVEAIPPAYTEHIGRQLIDHVRRVAT